MNHTNPSIPIPLMGFKITFINEIHHLRFQSTKFYLNHPRIKTSSLMTFQLKSKNIHQIRIKKKKI